MEIVDLQTANYVFSKEELLRLFFFVPTKSIPTKVLDEMDLVHYKSHIWIIHKKC